MHDTDGQLRCIGHLLRAPIFFIFTPSAKYPHTQTSSLTDACSLQLRHQRQLLLLTARVRNCLPAVNSSKPEQSGRAHPVTRYQPCD